MFLNKNFDGIGILTGQIDAIVGSIVDIIFLTASCYYSNWYPFDGTCQNRFLATYEIEYEIEITNLNEFDKNFILLFFCVVF